MKKTIKALTGLLLAAALLLALLPVPVLAAAFAGGDGTAANPYLISTSAQLNAVRDNLAACYKLTADISLSVYDSFAPIGNEDEGPFTGAFDGAGHTIRALTVTGENKYAGLFGYLEGTVRDVVLADANVAGGRFVGGIAGYAATGSSITGCTVSGSVTSGGAPIDVNAGGIAGYSAGELFGLTNRAKVNADCGSYYGVEPKAGGIAGLYSGEKISDCMNGGDILSNSIFYNVYLGGMIGYCSSAVMVTNCTNSGNVSGGLYSGGMIGFCSDATVTGCTNGNAILGENSGGIIGKCDNMANITQCINKGTIDSTRGDNEYHGGIAGWCASVTVSDCINYGSINSNNDSSYYPPSVNLSGGIIGFCNDVRAENCLNAGLTSAHSYCGGIVGSCQSATIQYCIDNGIVSNNSSDYGKLAGKVYDHVEISDCIICSVTRGRFGRFGSIIADNIKNTSTIYSSAYYSCGDSIFHVFSDDMLYPVNTYYWNFSPEQAFGTALSLTELSDPAVTVGFNYVDTWYTDPKLNSGLPMLRNSPQRLFLSDIVLILAPGASKALTAYLDGTATTAVSYSSSDLSIITVDTPGTVKAIANGSAMVSAVMADGTRANCAVYVITKANPLTLPETATVGKDCTISNLASQNGGNETIYWDSSDTSVLTVDNTGVITGVNPGTATVTATATTSGQTDTCTVTVTNNALNSVTLPSYLQSVDVGKTIALKATCSPADSTDTLTWKSSDESVAKVSQSGVVTGVMPGNYVTITVTSGSGKSASCQVQVVMCPSSSATVNVGATYSLMGPTTAAMSWKSSDENVATVSQTGTVTGVAPGTAVVTVTAPDGESRSCTVTVYAPAKSIKVNKPSTSIQAGLTEQLTATVLPANTTDTVTWSSSNTSVATVSSTGLVTAAAKGTAVITAKTSSGLRADCTVTVTPAVVLPTSVTISSAVARMAIGESKQLSASVLPANVTDKTITWTSSNPDVASISNSGAMTALAAGETTITATASNGVYNTCSVKVAVTSSAAFIVTPGRVRTGETIDVPVYIVRNPGIAAFAVTVNYDSSLLTPVSITPGELLSGGTFTTNLDDAGRTSLRATWYQSTDMTADGLAFTVKFRAGAAAGSGDVSVSHDAGGISNASKDEVNFQAETAKISVIDYLVGDIYADNEINMKDIVLLAQSFNHLATLTAQQSLAADLVYDGTVDAKDLVALVQLLADGKTAAPAASTASLQSEPETPFTVTVGSGTVSPGGTVQIPVTASGCPGVSAYRFAVHYNSNLFTITDITPAAGISGTFHENLADEPAQPVVYWYQTADTALDGTLFTITLQPKAGAKAGSCQVSVEPVSVHDITNAKLEDVSLTAEPGTLQLAEGVSIAAVSCTRQSGTASVTVTLDTSIMNETEALAVIAFYQGGQMHQVFTGNVDISKPGFTETIPTSLSNFTVRAFLLQSGSYLPLSAADAG
jgi:uncharacterized protein YjdB